MSEEILNPETTEMRVNESMKANLLSAAKWAKFICIVGCIGVGFAVVFGIAMLAFGSIASTKMYTDTPLGVIYLLVAAIYIYPLIKGFQFANATKAACLSDDENELARGISGLNDLLKFTGYLTIICLILYGFMLIGIFGVGVMAAVAA